MITGTSIKQKRISAGIIGQIRCMKLGIARSRLSDIELGYTVPKPEYLAQMDSALDDLIRARLTMQDAATAAGWPMTGANL